MEKRKYPALGKCRGKFSLIVGVLELSYIGAICYVLNINENDCDQPLRLWLQVTLLAFAMHFSVFFLTEILSSTIKTTCSGLCAYLSALINLSLSFFTFCWIILGSYWYFNTNELCPLDFYEGHLAVHTILIVYYSFLGTGCCLGCLMLTLTLIGGGITSPGPHN